MKQRNLISRRINIFATVFCLFLLAMAAYFQYVQGLQPCPLCLVQRWLVLLLALIFFWGIWLKRRCCQLLQSTIAFIVSAFGIAIGARHVWLQHFPANQVPECSPDLNFMLHNLPLRETLGFLFSGSGECTRVDWQFLGLSMAEWLLAIFIVFALLALINFRLVWVKDKSTR